MLMINETAGWVRKIKRVYGWALPLGFIAAILSENDDQWRRLVWHRIRLKYERYRHDRPLRYLKTRRVYWLGRASMSRQVPGQSDEVKDNQKVCK